MQPSMLQSWTRYSAGGLSLLSSLVPVALSQTVTTDIEACSLLDCSLATYILIGIAALYTLLSLICIVLICVACKCCKKRPRTRSKVQPQFDDHLNDLDDVFFFNSNHQLDSIPEANTEDFFANDDSEGESSSTTSSSSEGSVCELDSSQLVTGKKKRRKQRKQTKPGKSPLQTHQPKGSPIPPRKVPVPFSEPPEDEKVPQEHIPHPLPSRLPPIEREGTPRHRKKPATGTPQYGIGFSNPSSSPFQNRKTIDPQNEIAQDSDKGTPVLKKREKRTSPPRTEQKSISSPIDESTLKFEMVKISHKWRKVGKAFTLPTSVLNNISIICSNNRDACMRRICEEWMKLGKERDWIELVEILRSEEINEHSLADYLRIYYYKPEHGLLQFDEDFAEGNLSSHKAKNTQRETKPAEGDENDAEGSRTWL